MQAKSITSVVPAELFTMKLTVVALLSVSCTEKTVAVSSLTEHAHPFVAANPVAPFIVTTTVQEFAPNVIFPAVAPPNVEETEQPEVVNFVPPD